MNFYSKKYDFGKWITPCDIEYPAIVLYKDSWNDYGYTTLYHVRFFKDSPVPEKIGFLKILHGKNTDTILPEKFDDLSEEYCSLGTTDYYYKMRKCFKNETEDILQKLSDCAINEDVRDKFVDSEGFKDSLLRYTSSEKGLAEGKNIINGHSSEFNSSFSFDCEIGNFDNEHSISFNFEKSKFLPNRIICLIGKNGSGKTQYLSKLALGMSGQNLTLKRGFNDGRPFFSRVIAISYSIFDSFEKPKSTISSKDYDYGEKFSYVYCGFIETSERILSYEEIQVQLYESILKIMEMGKIKEWSESLSPLFNEKILSDLINEIRINERIYEIFMDDLLEDLEKEIEINIKDYNVSIRNIFKKIVNVRKFLYTSSGQGITLNCVTDVYANIRDETLIIFDEPETHLHPNAIYQLISILYEILNKTNSYAIIATHSPIIIQQIPSKYVRILSEIDNYVTIKPPSLETFGENLTSLTNEIFGNNMHEEYYKKILEQIAKTPTFRTEINIDEVFEGDLSLNARIFYEGKKNEINHN